MDLKKIWEEAAEYYFTALFVIINIVVFLICTFTKDLLYNKGAFYVWSFITDKEYYRLLSAIFLHYDINHLISNMILLFFLGRVVEKHIGHIPFFVVYMLSGIGGNIISGLWELKIEHYSMSAGASGAVFGLTGALLILVIFHKGKLDEIKWQGVVIMIFLSVYNGFVVDNINNAAHIGGLAIGIVITVIVLLTGRIKHEN